MKLQISRTQRQQMLDWAKLADPRECCGLLLGRNDVVELVELTDNVAGAPLTEFEIDPSALIAAERAARQGGPEILGYFHSHPNGLAAPSSTDAEMATDDGRIWLIIANGGIACWKPVSSGHSGHVSFVPEHVVWG